MDINRKPEHDVKISSETRRGSMYDPERGGGRANLLEFYLGECPSEMQILRMKGKLAEVVR